MRKDGDMIRDQVRILYLLTNVTVNVILLFLSGEGSGGGGGRGVCTKLVSL